MLEPRELTLLSVFVRIVIAIVLGGAIGMERGMKNRPAGLRTYMLVCIGACIVMITNQYAVQVFGAGDPVRMGAQVISGIGFLGAGTILHEGLTIRGLTTAASLWMVSAIGLAVGSGMFFLSAMATVITMITLVTFHTWEKRFAATSRSDRRFVRITTSNRNDVIADITGYLTLNGIQVKSLNLKKNKDKNNLVIDLYLKLGKNMESSDYILGLQNIEGVMSVENSKY